MQDPRLKRAFSLADQHGLDKEERAEFATMLLKRDITTWKSLKEDEVQRVVDALYGHHLLEVLKDLKKEAV